MEIPSTLFEYFVGDPSLVQSMNEATCLSNPSASPISSQAVDYFQRNTHEYHATEAFVVTPIGFHV